MTADSASAPDRTTGARPQAAAGPARVTLESIATALSVSTATVSLALRNSPLVAEATRQRVQDHARTMGYSYNRSAAALRTARSNMIGVGFHDIANPYFAELLTAIEATALEHGKSILLGTYAEDLDRQDRVLHTMREYRPDGMIVSPAIGTEATAYDGMRAANIPLVQVVREIEGIGLDFVGTDDEQGTAMAVDHLVELGHTRIGLIGGHPTASTGRRRHAGYRNALARHGLMSDPALLREGAATRETGFRIVQEMVGLPDAPTAIICFNDIIAFGAMLGLRQCGREPGRDVALIGSDDVEEARHWLPALTTLRNHQDRMGQEAAALLMRRIADPAAAPRRILLQPTLIRRGTTMQR